MLQNICTALGFKTIMVYNTPHRENGGVPYLTRGLQSVSQVGGVNSYSKP